MGQVNALAGMRVAIGAGAWLAPNLTGRLFGLDPKANPQMTFMGRLFGVRDLALGIGALASQDESRRLWLQLGAGCDALDAIAASRGARDGSLPKFAAVLSGTAAVSALALGVRALLSSER
ncbi:MAG: hypothetical protein ACR2ND_02070 [Solirubrobacteraceae bacterium]